MITSTKNQKIKNVMKLMTSSKARKEQDVFIVEGIRMFKEIDKNDYVEGFVSSDFYENNREYLKKCEKTYEVVDDKVFEQMSGTLTPQGIMAVVKQKHYVLEDIITTDRPAHVIVCENLQDPGNLGTIIRCGEGAGITGIIMSKNTVDIYNPKTIRSTMGSIFRIPFLYTDNLEETIGELKSKNVKMLAAHLKGKKNYDEVNYKGSVGFLIGNEGNGLTDKTANLADEYILIPMEGKVESLNAAIASSILMYEVNRQRRS